MENEFICLKSPAPLKNTLSFTRFVYLAAGIIGALLGVANGGLTGLVALCIFLLAIAYFVIYFVALGKMVKIRLMKFELPKEVDYESLSGLLVAPLTEFDMTVNRTGNIMITYKGCEFYIKLSADYFSIDPRESLMKRIFGKSHMRLYKRSIVAVPIIAYTIQDICRKQ
jgi:hypothetical protein